MLLNDYELVPVYSEHMGGWVLRIEAFILDPDGDDPLAFNSEAEAGAYAKSYVNRKDDTNHD